MMTTTSARVICLALLLAAAPSLAQSTSPDDASTEGNAYTNFFFQLRYPFSPSWVPQSAAATEQIREAGKARLGDDNPPASGSAPARTHTLLTLARNFPGTGPGGHSRALILLIAEDVSSSPGISSAKDCVQKIADRMKKANYSAVGDPQEAQFSGRKFFRQDLKGTSTAGAPVYESLFFTLARGYAVGFILAAPTQPALNGMVRTLDKLKFY